MSNQEIVLNEKRMIMIDPAKKTLQYMPLDKKNSPVRAMKQQLADADPSAALAAQLETATKVTYQGVKGDNKVYTIYTPEEAIQRTIIALHKNSHKISKVTYFYDLEKTPDVAKVILRYRKIDLNPNFSANHFADARFVQQKGGKYIGVGEYQTFDVSYNDQLKTLE